MAAVGISVGTAALVVGVFFLLGNPWNSDIAFHGASWLDVAGQWKEGIIFPRWMEWANYGFGEPRFIFYPPLSWILGAALTFVIPWKIVPSAFVFIVQSLAGISAHALARRFLSATGALLAAAFYAANPYALLDVYNRGAVAEELACALLPLVILFALNLSGLLKNSERRLTKDAAFFALAFSAAWLSDVPAAIMTSYCVALIFAWAAVEKRTLLPLWRGAGGLIWAFGLNSFYFVPILYEQHWASVERLLPDRELLTPSFLFYAKPIGRLGREQSPLPWIFSDALPMDWIVSNVAIFLLLIIVIVGIIVYRRRNQKERNAGVMDLWGVAVLLTAAATFPTLPASWIFWKYLPKLIVMQFPWRWVGVIAVPYALLLAAAIEWRRKALLWGAALLVFLGATSMVLVLQGPRSKIDLFEMQKAIADDHGFGGTAEYYPAADDFREFLSKYLNFKGHVPRVQILPTGGIGSQQATAEIRKWTAEERILQVASQAPAQVALRLLNYPAWQMEINGKPATTQRLHLGQIIVQVPAGNSEIRVRLSRTPDRLAGNVSSVICLLALVVAFGIPSTRWAEYGTNRVVNQFGATLQGQSEQETL